MTEREAGDGAEALRDLRWHSRKTGTDDLRARSDANVQAAALRTAFPQYAVNVLHRRGDRPRFEVVSRDGGDPFCLISTDPLEIWRELQKN